MSGTAKQSWGDRALEISLIPWFALLLFFFLKPG